MDREWVLVYSVDESNPVIPRFVRRDVYESKGNSNLQEGEFIDADALQNPVKVVYTREHDSWGYIPLAKQEAWLSGRY